MDYVILDMDFDVNILTRQTWESMGKLRLLWCSVHLRLANQLKVLPIGRMTQVPVKIEGNNTYANFKVIDIVEDTNMYPTLLGIESGMNKCTIINFKKRILTFEDDELWVVALLDPIEGHRYVKQVNNERQDGYLDHIYKIPR